MNPDEPEMMPAPSLPPSSDEPRRSESDGPSGSPVVQPERAAEPPLSQQEADRQARIAYLQSIAPPPPPKKKWPKFIIIIVILLAISTAAFLFLKKDHKAQSGQTTGNTTTQSAQNQPSASNNQPITTKHYDSKDFNLGLDYPDDWRVDANNGTLTITSKTLRLKSVGGETINSRAVVTIRPKQTTLSEFSRGNAVAVLDSEKITYTKPTQSQRAQTYISFVDYPQSTGQGIDGIYITGDLGYQKGQAVPLVDIVRVDPLVTVSFVQCPNSACNGGTSPLTLDSSAWSDASTGLAAGVKSVLTSLSIQ